MAINPFRAISKMFDGTVQTLNDGASITIDARGSFLTVITGAGTATVSRVNSASATADVGSAEPDVTAVAAASRATFSGLEWGFLRITATGGALRYFTSP